MDYRASRSAADRWRRPAASINAVKRPGQFWSQSGDEALMYLEAFWHNGRRHFRFSYSSFNPTRKTDALVTTTQKNILFDATRQTW